MHQWKVTEIKEVARLYMDGYGYAAISEKTGIPKESIAWRVRSMKLREKVSSHVAPHFSASYGFSKNKAP